MIIEGWAELLAYRYAQNKSGRYQLAAWDIENNQDPVYGNGFRLVAVEPTRKKTHIALITFIIILLILRVLRQRKIIPSFPILRLVV
jgi:hypothetical protein